MSKTLYIVRHAKASREDLNLRDWERSLIPIGVERAGKIAKTLKRKKILPDKIISSHAFRALNTAIIFALGLDYPVDEISISNDIYEKDPGTIIDLVKKQEENLSSLMIFGHNPTFTELVNSLTAENIDTLSTSAVACIKFEADNWASIQLKKGKCLFIETGK